MLKKSLIIAAVVALTGCASVRVSPAAALIKPSDGSGMSACQFLGDYTAEAQFGMSTLDNLRNAQLTVLNQIGAAGATHVVWTALSPGPRALAQGRAYRCGS